MKKKRKKKMSGFLGYGLMICLFAVGLHKAEGVWGGGVRLRNRPQRHLKHLGSQVFEVYLLIHNAAG